MAFQWNSTKHLRRINTYSSETVFFLKKNLVCVESEKTPSSQGNIKKENHSWGHHNARSQVVLQSCGHQDSVVLAQKQTQINGTE